jgi:hypothetical protein
MERYLDELDRRVDAIAARPLSTRVARWVLVIVGAALWFWATVAIKAALQPSTPDHKVPILTGAIALNVAGGLCILRRREGVATGLLAALATATFALSLAELTLADVNDPGRYSGLWIPCVLGILVGVIRIAGPGWRD